MTRRTTGQRGDYGAGTVEFRGGQWWLRVSTVVDGKRVRVRLGPYPTRELAEAAKRRPPARQSELAQDAAAFVTDWCKHRAATLEGNKQRSWARIIERAGRLYLGPTLPAGKTLDAVTIADCNSMWRQLLAGNPARGQRPLAHKTVREQRHLLIQVFDAAMDADLLTRNVAERSKVPAAPRRPGGPVRPKAFTEPEAILLADALAKCDSQFALPTLVALGTGMRRGEVVGLHVKNFRPWRPGTPAMISVTGQVQREFGEDYWQATKTEQSERDILISRALSQRLELMRRGRRPRPVGDAYLFAHYLDPSRPIVADSWSNWFDKFCRRQGLEPLGLHALRRTHASILTSQGVSMPDVAARLGHSDVATTMRSYAKADRTRMERTAIAFEQVVGI